MWPFLPGYISAGRAISGQERENYPDSAEAISRSCFTARTVADYSGCLRQGDSLRGVFDESNSVVRDRADRLNLKPTESGAGP